MSKPSRKKSRKLEVQIMFEPNRLEQDSLHKAYSCLAITAGGHTILYSQRASLADSNV
jgi:hypothetical protein